MSIPQTLSLGVIEAGRVVQQGTFEELASVPRMFAKLMAKQGKKIC